MKTLVKNLYKAGISARVAVLSFDDYNKSIIRYTLEEGKKKWAKNPKEADSLISQAAITNGAKENHVDALEAVAGLKYRGNTTRFAVMLTDEPLTKNDNHSKIGAEGIAKKLKEANIITSVVCRNYNITSFQPIFTETDGIQISLSSNFNYILETFIETVMRESSSFTVVLPNTLSTITLEQSPRQKDTTTDSDGDMLPDSKEIKWNLIKEEGDALILPTLFEYAGYHPLVFFRLSKKKKEYINSILILPIYSNPAAKDSDHDGYPDNKDKKPLVKSVKTYSLKNKEYIKIRYFNKKDKVYKDSYGGNQGWFDASNYFSEDYILNGYGCGTIALADTFLYWAKQDAKKNTGVTKKCLAEKPLTEKTYKEYVKYINRVYTHTPRWLGVIGPALEGAMNAYTFKYLINYSGSWRYDLNNAKMKALIIEMLKNDLPVIFSVGPNTPNITGEEVVKLYYQLKEGDDKYEKEKTALYQYKSMNSVNGHYMTITELIIDENTVNKDESVMLHVSSWGEEYYIKYSEYRDYVKEIGGKWSSSMLHVKKKFNI